MHGEVSSERSRKSGKKQERKRTVLFLPLFLIFLLYFRLRGAKCFLSLSLSPLLPPLINPLPLREEAISLFFPPPPGIENDDTLFPASRSRGLAINYPSLLSFPPPFFNFLERRNPSPLPLCSSGPRMDPSRNNGNRKVELVSNTRNLCILERKNGGRSYNWWIFDFCIFDNGDDFLMYKIIFNIRSLENN